MEEFIKKFSDVPNAFVEDFFNIAKESYGDSELTINFDNVVKWLEVRKDNLKSLMVKHFSENYDYSIEKIKTKNEKGVGYNFVENILITPDCFKELCMLSQTAKAKEVRYYYLSIEKLIKKYHQYVEEKLLEKINLFEVNQKPKINVKGGVIYFFKALNQIKINELDEDDFKIGKTKNKNNRFKTYNSGNANDIEPLFILEVDDIDKVEGCIKNLLKDRQYRKYKEIYHINIDALKLVFSDCDKLIKGFKTYIDNHPPAKVDESFKKMRRSENGLVLLFKKQKPLHKVNHQRN